MVAKTAQPLGGYPIPDTAPPSTFHLWGEQMQLDEIQIKYLEIAWWLIGAAAIGFLVGIGI